VYFKWGIFQVFIVEGNFAIKFKTHSFPATRLYELYYIKNQQDATLAVSFISQSKITLHVSDAFCVHHLEY